MAAGTSLTYFPAGPIYEYRWKLLEPFADGFRNYVRAGLESVASALLLDKVQLLGLIAPEMTVLVGGLRSLNANTGQSPHGVFTAHPETLYAGDA